jgi:uncharacterized alpha-E superfamily protein
MLLSSVAERVYWMARYIERAENTARIILVHNNLMLDMPHHIPIGWEPLVYIMGSIDTFNKRYEEAAERHVIRFLVADRNNPNCITCSLAMARENLRTTRAIVPRACRQWYKSPRSLRLHETGHRLLPAVDRQAVRHHVT